MRNAVMLACLLVSLPYAGATDSSSPCAPAVAAQAPDGPEYAWFHRFVAEYQAHYRSLAEMEAVADQRENFLGDGNERAVYAIPGLPDFAIRLSYYSLKSPPESALFPVPDLLPGRNIGQPIADINGDDILLRQAGESLFEPEERHRPQEVETFRRHVHQLATAPQESYDRFFALVRELADRRLDLDFSHGGNLLFDASTNSINLVDVGPEDKRSGRVGWYPGVATFIRHFTGVSALPGPDRPIERLALFPDRRKIVWKCLRAAHKIGDPLLWKRTHWSDPDNFFRKLQMEMSPEEASQFVKRGN
jgi:hypothetical protein